MRAVSSSSGGVMFIPEKIERKTKSVSYSDLVEEHEKTDTKIKIRKSLNKIAGKLINPLKKAA